MENNQKILTRELANELQGDDIVIPDGYTEIEGNAFAGRYTIKSIKIPDSVTKIGDYAFMECTMLKSITLPDSVTSIGKQVFDNEYGGALNRHITYKGKKYYEIYERPNYGSDFPQEFYNAVNGITKSEGESGNTRFASNL
jgi:hypothetical protein